MSEYDDRVPQEAYEPHDELIVDVHVAFTVGVQFSDEPPKDIDDWIEALRQHVVERVSAPSWVGLDKSDIIEWAVVDVVPPNAETLEEYIELLIDVAARGQADTPGVIAAQIRALVGEEKK